MPTALIVEDEPEANHLLSMLVTHRGFLTESAYTGSQALDFVSRRIPDIVFLDLMLPDMTGFEVCQRLKTQKSTSLIPVVMVTARVAADNRGECFGIGADEYVPKPYMPDQIFQAITDATGWSDRVSGEVVHGTIPIESACGDETLRRHSQLRSILLARTSLDLDAVQNVSRVIAEIRQAALDWSRRAGSPLRTRVVYLVERDVLTLTVEDGSGWLAEEGPTLPGRWSDALAAAQFAIPSGTDPRRSLTFFRRYPPSEPTFHS
jgi:DNA-binding response OmpR family regulator